MARDPGWSEVFDDLGWQHRPVDGAPARASVQEFERVADQAAEAASNLGELTTILRSVEEGWGDGFKGQAAEAFGAETAAAREELDVASHVFGDLSAAMRLHANQLAHIQAQASQTLARARTAWHDRHGADADAAGAEGEAQEAESRRQRALRLLAHWEDELDGMTIDDGGYTVAEGQVREQRAVAADAASDREHARRVHDDAVARREAAVERLRRARRDDALSWQRLHDRANDLDAETAGRIARLELADLADPGMLDAVLGKIADWVGDLLQNLYDIGAALLTGDFERGMFALRELLEKVSTVLAVVGAILTVVGTVFPPAAALGVTLSALAFGVALAHTALTTTLAASRLVDPKTGRPLGFGDVLSSTLDLALVTIGLKGAQNPILRTLYGRLPMDQVRFALDGMKIVRRADEGSQVIEAADHLLDAHVDTRTAERVRAMDVRTGEFPVTQPPEAFIGGGSDAITAIESMEPAVVEYGGRTTPRLCSVGG